ncbi:MAG: tRNA pseudouridine(38-40) synthase TruA [Prevotellaceae bacterium]|jgi:tRNA pseudouridine38-40 synthase|nr:tRNA pseudouridine(38-40) synthase TruA [Prevotellaceae bacterium]
MRYFVELSYSGKNYSGWQAQKNAKSVQGVLENALSTVLRTEIQVVGAGRTDTGVHAKFMTAHFDFAEKFDNQRLVNQLNGFLPKDIAVDKVIKVKNDAHARFDAVRRTYKYFLCQNKNPFLEGFALFFSQKLDFEKMNRAANILLDYQDFTSFSKLHSDVKTNNCTVFQAKWEHSGEVWVFTIQANRFLRNMVRAIVGTLLMIGTGKVSIEQFRQIIEAKDRGKAGSSAPAHGLYLVDILYNNNIFFI